MPVTPEDIAVELGVAAPSSSQTTQWSSWIDQAVYLIGKRLGDVAQLDQADVDYVVLQAVAAHVRNPDSATQVDVRIDDAATSRRYSSSAGRVEILPEWWALLSPEPTNLGGAYSVPLGTPFGLP